MPQKQLTLEAVNLRLKSAKVGVEVRQKGKRLYLRATLPPKPGSARVKPHQQEIALGIYANPAGLERAEAEARKVGALLACKEFDWAAYGSDTAKGEKLTREQWVERFKKHYTSTHTLTERTWKKHWEKVYDRLAADKPLSAAAMVAVALNTEQNTRSRKQTCDKLQKLADYAGIEVNLKQYQGNYSVSKAKPRDLPTDELIVEWRDRIPYKPWQWVYGMLATYGLRPHEAFFCEFVEGDPNCALQVTEGKTGARVVYPLYLEWVERWQLKQIHRPRISPTGIMTEVYEQYGNGTTRQFQRYEVPFPAYDLRHAYAIRASVVFGFPVATAAAYMGHSPTVHWNRYNRWISERQHAETFEKYMSREHRPVAP